MNLFTLEDFLNVYSHSQIVSSIEIACWLLSRLKDEKSLKLFNKLMAVKYEWNMPEKELQKVTTLLLEAKKWLLANYER